MALNGGMRMEYSHAVSFKIDCADQAEVDRLWDTLIANGGQAERCGWLKDRYGLSWQIVPTALPMLSALLPRTMLLADRGYDADWIRELARQQGA
jgi:predicted 3-demethylubiquinone-9 3-methyltransferase (glyoxalase superfamily)